MSADWLGIQPTLIFDSVISEGHHWSATITDNPVETGVSLSDHAYMNPDELTIEVAVSDTPLIEDSTGEGRPSVELATLFTAEGRRSVDAMKQLREWTESFIPFSLVTGLKVYKDMLIKDGSVNQSKDTAGVLRATLSLRQVQFASTATVVYPPRAANKPKRQASKVAASGKKEAEEPDDNTKKHAAPSIASSITGWGE